MNRTSKHLHLGVSANGLGNHMGGWRTGHVDPLGWADVGHYQQIARIAERGTFDAVLLADIPCLMFDTTSFPPLYALEPTLLIAAMAGATDRVGFLATVSTTFNEPYNIARRLSSLDHMSKGRVSLNAVTTLDPNVAANFGLKELPVHDVRYRRAQEFLDVVIKLWDGWEDDAVIADPEAGLFADTSRIHQADHEGPLFSVRGPLALPRSPQGRPVLMQSGASEQGRDLAARYAEAVYATHLTLEDAQAYYRDLKDRARRFGRPAGLPKILLGILPVVGGTMEEARARQVEMDALLNHQPGLTQLAFLLHVNPDELDLDAELPTEVIERARGLEQGSRGFAEAMVNAAIRERLTVRELIARQAGFRQIVGGPSEISDMLGEWFEAEAADGFILNVDVFPTGLEAFVDLVVPELRRRDLFRESYDGVTLRDHLGLSRPRSQYEVGRDARAAVAS